MNGIIAFFVAIFTFFASVFGFAGKIKTPVDVADDFTPVLRFVVSSDSHVQAIGDKQTKRIQKMIGTAYEVAAEDESYNSLDAVVMVGDLTDDGRKTQYVGFASAINSSIKEGTEFIGVAAKSHDCNTMGRDALDYYTKVTGCVTDTHKIINGYHFIGISASKDASVHYSDEQIAWLDAQIAEAVADDPAKPVFVFQHEHIKNTVYGSYPEDGWGDTYFVDTLSKYPQVIDISGHSHYPANDPRAIWQGEFTAVNDGGLAYYEFTVDGQNKYHPSDRYNMAQCLIVEVNADNAVRIRVYDLTAEKFVYEHFLENGADPSALKYSHELRAKSANAPVFSKSAVLSVEKKADKYTFTAPVAHAFDEGDIVFLYRLVIRNENGEVVKNEVQLSDYYSSGNAGKVSFTVNLDRGSYMAELTAEDAWGKQSFPLMTKI